MLTVRTAFAITSWIDVGSRNKEIKIFEAQFNCRIDETLGETVFNDILRFVLL